MIAVVAYFCASLYAACALIGAASHHEPVLCAVYGAGVGIMIINAIVAWVYRP